MPAEPRAAPTATHDGSHETVYYPYFDWLRFALALVVLLSHSGAIAWEHAGNLAVHVFFVLSGWLIGGILLNTKPRQMPRFFFNRALRIWVPYYIAAALLIGVSIYRDGIGWDWAQIVTMKALMVYNLFSGVEVTAGFPSAPLDGTGHHFWSVNAEEQFYLAAPLLLVFVPKWGRQPAVWALIAALFVAIGTDYPGLSVGVLAAILLKDRQWHVTPRATVAWLLLAAACVPLLRDAGSYARAAPFFGLALVMLLARRGHAAPVATALGGASYPLYLNHWIGIFAGNWLASRLAIGPWLHHATIVAAALGFALVHYMTVDRTIRAHRSRWYTREAGWAVSAFAYCIFAAGLVFGFMTVGRIV